MLRRINSETQPVFDKLVDPISGTELLTAIAVDSAALATEGIAAIRMVGYMNREAYNSTLETSRMTFYSRSQQGLWVKGETSGDFLVVRDAYIDCDLDTVIIDAAPLGPTCHTGQNSCFEQPNIGE